MTICLIWGSTWIVIKDQIADPVPPAWSVAYRFLIAATLMFGWAAATRVPLRMGPRGHLFALLFGVPQFCLNFNFVYAAEAYVTSGLVATVFALQMVPNSALAWLFLRQRAAPAFVAGSALACLGVALLFVQEARASALPVSATAIGTSLALLGLVSAAAGNVMQAGRWASARPLASQLAWGMFYGALANILLAWISTGPPTLSRAPLYWAGVAYLGLVASAFAFSLFFLVLRAVGPGKAAYCGVVIPILAMAISTFAEDYRWSAMAIAGGALAVAGMVIALRSRVPE